VALIITQATGGVKAWRLRLRSALIPYFEDETLEVIMALKAWPGGQLIAVGWDNYLSPFDPQPDCPSIHSALE
jgi:hypothetical protein